jgi:hypothetical protein
LAGREAKCSRLKSHIVRPPRGFQPDRHDWPRAACAILTLAMSVMFQVAFRHHGSEPPSAGTGAYSRRIGRQGQARGAERKAIADAQNIVAIWNARQAGRPGRSFHPTIGAATAAGSPWPSFSCPACAQFGWVDPRTLLSRDFKRQI